MISKSSQTIIDNCLSNIAQHLPDFKQRPAQYQMIMAVANNFSQANKKEEATQNGESILVIEGPTGTGKSLGYLLPAVVMAKAQEKKLIVSSATVMLQEQLANKDIPFFAKHIGLDVSFAIAKGRGRYACTFRLKEKAGIVSTHAAQYEMDMASSHSEIDKNIFLQMAQELIEDKWSGDRDSLNKSVPDAIWSQITNDRHGCTKRHCPDFANCPFFKAREELETVDIVIANHDLLLADIAMGGGVILPSPSESFYCIDEGHHLADKAIKQFAASHSINGTRAWLEKIGGVVDRALGLLNQHNNQITDLTESLDGYLMDFRTALRGFSELHLNSNDSTSMRFKHGVVPEKLLPLCQNLSIVSKSLLTVLNILHDNLKLKKSNAEGSGAASLYDRSLIDLGFYIGRVENIVAVWNLFSAEISKDKPPIAKWITCEWTTNKNQYQQEQMEYTIHASPVSAAHLLATRFWQQIAGAVLTSATLRSLGSFDLLLNETGLKQFSKTKCLALDSPFDFEKQGQLIIPAMKSDPKDPFAHTQELISLMPSYLPSKNANGALVLFSSRKQMHDVAQGLPAHLRALLLIQGEESKDQLLKKHLKRIAEIQPSILFGLASFAEGLDLPGNACNHLLIAKLPFAVPDDPVSETLADWITQQGKNAFMEMSLPAASIKLIQAVGRLIRQETDTGTVTIFDTRLKTKSYGRLLLNSLPKFRRVT